MSITGAYSIVSGSKGENSLSLGCSREFLWITDQWCWENPLIKFSRSKTQQNTCEILHSLGAVLGKRICHGCLPLNYLSGSFSPSCLVVECCFFLSTVEKGLLRHWLSAGFFSVAWNRLSQKYLSGFVSPQCSWHNLRGAGWIWSIWGEKESVYCPILTLGVDQTVSIIPERFPWCWVVFPSVPRGLGAPAEKGELVFVLGTAQLGASAGAELSAVMVPSSRGWVINTQHWHSPGCHPWTQSSYGFVVQPWAQGFALTCHLIWQNFLLFLNLFKLWGIRLT